MIADGKTYYDPHEPDWLNLIEQHPFKKDPESMFMRHDTRRLKPEVMQWLAENIKDRKGEEHKQGWAVGTDRYNSNDAITFHVFFQSSRDALKFIKRWSSYKKPVDYLNYFKDIRKKLNLETGKLCRVPRWRD